MKNSDQQLRLRVFWGTVVFSLGVLWGISNLVYSPIAAMTTIPGSSWLEVLVVIAGGALSLLASVGAFFRRRMASRFLLSGGPVLLFIAIAGQILPKPFSTHGAINLLLLFLSGAVACGLGLFGAITERNGWPPLRGDG